MAHFLDWQLDRCGALELFFLLFYNNFIQKIFDLNIPQVWITIRNLLFYSKGKL